MTRFPEQITVRVVAPQENHGVQGILVALHLFVAGRPYYGTLLGATDEGGTVSCRFQSFLDDFSRDRRFFPMDYKEPLERCDPRIEIVVRGGREFVEHTQAVLANPSVDVEVREAYRLAQNERIESARAHAELDGSREILIEMPVRPSR